MLKDTRTNPFISYENTEQTGSYLSEVSFSRDEIDHLHALIAQLIQSRGQSDLADIANAAAILHKPEWMEELYACLRAQGISVSSESSELSYAINIAWKKFSHGTPAEAASYISKNFVL